jgi:Xaa-Pro dipeptidase
VMPHNNYERLVAALPGQEFVDVSERIRNVRAVKSEFEIGLIKKAAQIVGNGVSSVREHMKVGMREIELGGKIESVMRSLGHQGVMRFRRWNHELHFGNVMSGPDAAELTYVASPAGGKGPSVLLPQGSGFRKIKKNEPVLIDYVGVYNGYHADMTRVFCAGKLSKKFERAYDATRTIQKTVVEMMRPGAKVRDIYERAESLAKELGYHDNMGGPPEKKAGFIGHGVGLEIDEYPILGPLDQNIFAGMVVAVEPKMIYPGKGVVGVEDTYAVTKDGPERLTKLAQGVFYV